MAGSKKGLFYEWARRVIQSNRLRVNPDDDGSAPALPMYVTQLMQQQMRKNQDNQTDQDSSSENAQKFIHRPPTANTAHSNVSEVCASIDHGESMDDGSSFWNNSEDEQENSFNENFVTGPRESAKYETKMLETDLDVVEAKEDTENWHECNAENAESTGDIPDCMRGNNNENEELVQEGLMSPGGDITNADTPVTEYKTKQKILDQPEVNETTDQTESSALDANVLDVAAVANNSKSSSFEEYNVHKFPDVHPLDDLNDDNTSMSNQRNSAFAGCADVATQTYFKQGFLKPWQRKNSGSKKSRRNSDPMGKTLKRKKSLEMIMERNEKVINNWQRLMAWTRQRRRSQRPSLKVCIQGRGGRPLLPRRQAGPENGISATKTHLDAYLKFMYYVCVSTRNADKNKHGIQMWAETLQKAWFWMFSIFAIAHSIDLLKYYIISFLDDGKLHDYIHLGFLLIYCITRIYSLILHAFRNENIRVMTRNMNEATLNATTSKYMFVWAYLLGGSSLLLAMLYSLFGNRSFKEWSFEETFLVRAYEMGHAIFVWSTTNYENVTAKLGAEYGSHITWTTLTMAIPEFILSFCGNLEDFVLGDLMLTAAISLHNNLAHFEKDIKSRPAQNVTYLEFKKKWEEYEILARASESFYETCGTLLTLYHIYNLLEFAAFLRLILVKKTAYFVFIATTINVVKSLVTYSVAVRISDKNQICRNWVRRCAYYSLSRKKQKNRKLYMKAILMLDEMKDNPLGLGRDELFINKGFLITFLGMAASLFVMLAEYAGESGKC